MHNCIVSIAAFHHLDLNTTLPKVKSMLKDDGVLIVLDLYECRGIVDFMLDCTAVPVNIILKFIKNKTLKEALEAAQQI